MHDLEEILYCARWLLKRDPELTARQSTHDHTLSLVGSVYLATAPTLARAAQELRTMLLEALESQLRCSCTDGTAHATASQLASLDRGGIGGRVWGAVRSRLLQQSLHAVNAL